MIVMMRASVCGLMIIMCLALEGCGLYGNSHGQSIEQNIIQNAEQREPEVVLPVDTWEQNACRIFEDGLIDVEIQRNLSYSLWNQELGQTILMCPYDEVHLLSKGYEELEQAIDILNTENADNMGVFYEEWKAYMEGRIETGDTYASYEMLPFGFYRKIYVLRSDQAVFSLMIDDTEWLGGFHPDYFSIGINFDPLTGRRLRLADVVTDYDRIYELVLEQLASAEYINEDGRCVLVEGYEEIVNQEFYPQEPEEEQIKWWLDTEGITVAFDTYELASYVVGNQVLDFSFEELGDLVRPQYVYHSEDWSR